MLDAWLDLWANIEPDDLPGNAAAVARERGLADARYMVETWGGDASFYVPTAAHVARVGLRGDVAHVARERSEALARWLVEAFGGGVVYFPSRSSVLQSWRDARLLGEFDGTNSRALARRYGLSVTYLDQLIARLAREEREA